MTSPITPVNQTGPTIVCEMVEGYSLTLNEDGHAGTRKFITASYLPNETSMNLPELGDSWSGDYPNLRLTNIQVNYLNDNDNCPFIYTCSYTNRADTITVWANEDDLPTSVSCGPEFVSLPVTKGKWSWSSDGVDLAETQSVFKNTIVMNIAIRRTIKNLKEFNSTSIFIQGKLNNKEWYGMPIGTVMYTGFEAEETRTPYLNSRRWNLTLNFSVRVVPTAFFPDGEPSSYEGWNYILRENNGTFDAPIDEGGRFLYSYEDFAPLMTVAQIGSDIGIMFPNSPGA